MKMNQAVYDVWVMKFCEEKILTGKDYQDLEIFDYFCRTMKEEYSDSYDCVLEFPGVSDAIIEQYKDTRALLLLFIQRSIPLRMEMNDDMEKKSGLRKIFGGKFFAKPPSNVEQRRNSSFENITSLIDFQHAKRN